MSSLNFEILTPKLAPVLDTSAYTANDVLFATTAVPCKVSSGKIRGVEIIDKDDVGEAAKLIFLRSNVALGTFNAAPSISDANSEEIIAETATITAALDLGGTRSGFLAMEIPFNVEPSGTLYVAGITTTALTHTAGGVVFNISIEKWS
jgi:hypothetical protein